MFHTGYVWPTNHKVGSFGVDIFFVISGYIMARICDTNPSLFLRRRLIRIIPPYWVLTLILFAASSELPKLLGATRASWKDLIESLLFIPFIKESGLFRPVLFVGWSLNFEMFFYLAIAVSLLIHQRRAIWIACGLVIACELLCRQFGQAVPALRFFSDTVMFEFPWGVAAYYIAKLVPPLTAVRFRAVWLVLAISSTLFLLLSQCFGVHWPVLNWSSVSVMSFLLVCSSALLSKGEWDTRSAALVLVGDASYILYLLHPYCIYFIGRILAPHLAILTISRLPGSFFATAITILVAVWAHLKLELPAVKYLNMRFGGGRRTTEFKPTT